MGRGASGDHELTARRREVDDVFDIDAALDASIHFRLVSDTWEQIPDRLRGPYVEQIVTDRLSRALGWAESVDDERARMVIDKEATYLRALVEDADDDDWEFVIQEATKNCGNIEAIVAAHTAPGRPERDLLVEEQLPRHLEVAGVSTASERPVVICLPSPSETWIEIATGLSGARALCIPERDGSTNTILVGEELLADASASGDPSEIFIHELRHTQQPGVPESLDWGALDANEKWDELTLREITAQSVTLSRLRAACPEHQPLAGYLVPILAAQSILSRVKSFEDPEDLFAFIEELDATPFGLRGARFAEACSELGPGKAIEALREAFDCVEQPDADQAVTPELLKHVSLEVEQVMSRIFGA